MPLSQGKDLGRTGEAVRGKGSSETLERDHSCSPLTGKYLTTDERRQIYVHLAKVGCYLAGFRVVSLNFH